MRSTREHPTGPERRVGSSERPPNVWEAPRVEQDAVDRLIALLDLETIEVNTFRGISPDETVQRVFGGQVAGQALIAAARTVETTFHVHSLHAYFLRPGDPTVPILYEVDRIRDGRSFVTRRVVAIQHGRAIFNMSASFHVPEPGLRPRVPDGRRRRPRGPPRLQDPLGSRTPSSSAPGTPGPGPSTPDTSTGRRRTARRRCRLTSGSGCVPTGRCRTTRCCTPACSPTPRT